MLIIQDIDEEINLLNEEKKEEEKKEEHKVEAKE